MADLTAYRVALAADLALEFPNADVLQGERSGKAADKAKVALFWDTETEVSSAVVVGQARLLVRYWPVSPKLTDDATAGVRDPTGLEAARDALQSFLQGKQTSYPSTGVWFSRLVAVRPDYDPEEWGVEGELLLMFTNAAVVA